MLRKSIRYIFKLSKHQSLLQQPVRKVSGESENLCLLPPNSKTAPTEPRKVGQARYSNQMSS